MPFIKIEMIMYSFAHTQRVVVKNAITNIFDCKTFYMLFDRKI